MIRVIILILVTVLFSTSNGMALDSLGIEKRGDKIFVLHKVEAGETAFSISKRYGTTVIELTRSNPDATPNISIGEVLKVPYSKKVVIKDPKATYHAVQPSETLYSISKKYNTTVDQLINWNKLEANSLKIGQELVVYSDSVKTEVAKAGITKKTGKLHTVEQGQTLYSISKQYGVSIEELKQWNALEGNTLDIGTEIVVGNDASEAPAVIVTPTQETDSTVAKVEVAATEVNDVRTGGSSPRPRPLKGNSEIKRVRHKKVTETGLAELIEGSNNTKKYLALHRTAPVGTIMQVKNEMNHLSVFVRVIGKLPNTGENEKLILKISQKAYDRLGAVDKRFRVKINYAP